MIAPVVEGHGEILAVPELVRRLGWHLSGGYVEVAPPYRMSKNRMLMPGQLETTVDTQADFVPGRGGVLVLLDADDDCPKSLGPELLARARAARTDKRVGVVVANREFEAWFLAGLPDEDRPADPESIRGAKERLAQVRGVYRPTAHQARWAATFDLELARRHAPSFDKLCRELEMLLATEGE